MESKPEIPIPTDSEILPANLEIETRVSAAQSQNFRDCKNVKSYILLNRFRLAFASLQLCSWGPNCLLAHFAVPSINCAQSTTCNTTLHGLHLWRHFKKFETHHMWNDPGRSSTPTVWPAMCARTATLRWLHAFFILYTLDQFQLPTAAAASCWRTSQVKFALQTTWQVESRPS